VHVAAQAASRVDRLTQRSYGVDSFASGMKTASNQKNLFPIILSAGTASLFALVPVSAKAVTTFDLSSPTSESFASKLLSVDGIILKLSNPIGTTLPSTPFNTNGSGFCAYTFNSGSGTRCGTSAASSLQGFSLEFDKSVFLRQFNVSNFTSLASGVITFTAGSNVKQFNFSATGLQSFDNPFLASAGSTVFVTTSALPTSTNGIFRIADLQVDLAPVPGPLPLLGAGVAFAYSRKLRSRVLNKAG